MCDGERRHDDDQRTETPERNDQAQQEQQVIDAAENVEQPIDDKPRCRLEPARVEPNKAGVAMKLKRPLDDMRQGTSSGRACASCQRAGRTKSQHRHRTQPGCLEPRRDGDARPGRRSRILQHHIHQCLIRREVDVSRQRRASDVCQRMLVRIERCVGRQRHARASNMRSAELTIFLEQIDTVRDPPGGLFERRGWHASKIQQRPLGGPLDLVHHGGDWRSHEEAQTVGALLKKGLNPDIAGDFVRREAGWRQQRSREEKHAGNLLHSAQISTTGASRCIVSLVRSG